MLSIIMFSTSTCVHCKPMKQTLEELAEKYPKDVYLKIWVVDQQPIGRETAREWNVMAVPTTVFIKNGQEIGTLQGNVEKEKLETLIEGSIQSDVLPESPGGVADTCSPVLCDSSEQADV